jgi:hypothetical protein
VGGLAPGHSNTCSFSSAVWARDKPSPVEEPGDRKTRRRAVPQGPSFTISNSLADAAVVLPCAFIHAGFNKELRPLPLLVVAFHSGGPFSHSRD